MTIPASSLTAIQAALYTLLSDTAEYSALCAVYDHVPAKPPYPHTVIGEAMESPDRTMGQLGHEVVLMLTTYTKDASSEATGRAGSVGFKQGLTIVEVQTRLLVEAQTFAVTGYSVTMVEVDSIQTSRGADGVTRIIDANYRIWLEYTGS